MVLLSQCRLLCNIWENAAAGLIAIEIVCVLGNLRLETHMQTTLLTTSMCDTNPRVPLLNLTNICSLMENREELFYWYTNTLCKVPVIYFLIIQIILVLHSVLVVIPCPIWSPFHLQLAVSCYLNDRQHEIATGVLNSVSCVLL